MKNVAFIGLGGVGGYFGGKMAQIIQEKENELNLYFIARGKHLEKIKEHGLIVNTNKEGSLLCKPTLVTDNFNDLPMLDICYICVKGYDLNDVLFKIKDKIHEGSKIIPLLNGVNIYERIRKIIDKGIVFPACVYIGTHIKEPGVVEQNGGACKIIFGRDLQHLEYDAEEICKLMGEANIDYDWTEDHIKEIWSKFMFIAAYGLVTAYKNQTFGEIRNDKDSIEKVLGIMNEIYDISKSEGINLPEDIVEASFNKINNFPNETKTSFQRDFENRDKKDERDLFGQAIIDLGIKNNINTDVTRNIFDELNKIKKNEF